jgi:hypothetical protein
MRRKGTLAVAAALITISSTCNGQTCPENQPKGVKAPVLAPQNHHVCRYDRRTSEPSQPPYWWELLFNLFQWKPAAQPPFRRSIAFLAGVSEYTHISPQLDFVKNDLTDFRNFLLTDGGFDTVYEVRDGNVTREVFDDFMKKYFSDPYGGGLAGSEDRLLVYYSGHGGAQADAEPYLLFQKAVPGDYTREVLAVREIYGWARTVVAKHLLIILDSCFSGLVVEKSGPDDRASGLSNSLAGEPSGVLITAGTGAEAAYAERYSKEKNGSIFTHALIEALRNMSREEGIITLGEAFERAKVSVAVFNAVENRKMTPLSTPLARKSGIGKGNFIFINTKARNPPLPSSAFGGAVPLIKAQSSSSAPEIVLRTPSPGTKSVLEVSANGKPFQLPAKRPGIVYVSVHLSSLAQFKGTPDLDTVRKIMDTLNSLPKIQAFFALNFVIRRGDTIYGESLSVIDSPAILLFNKEALDAATRIKNALNTILNIQLVQISSGPQGLDVPGLLRQDMLDLSGIDIEVVL